MKKNSRYPTNTGMKNLHSSSVDSSCVYEGDSSPFFNFIVWKEDLVEEILGHWTIERVSFFSMKNILILHMKNFDEIVRFSERVVSADYRLKNLTF